MIHFLYKGISPEGLVTEQLSIRTLLRRLQYHRQNQTTCLSIQPCIHLKKTLQTQQLIQTLEMLAFFLDAGYSLSTGLSLLAKHKPKQKQIFQSIYKHIEQGSSFSNALTHYIHKKHHIIGHMITLGEHANKISLVLKEVVHHLKKQQKTQSDFRHALTYPLLLILIVGVMIWGLLDYLLPTVLPIIAQQNSVSGTSKALINIYSIYKHMDGINILWGLCGLLCVGMTSLYFTTPLWRDRLFINAPIIGLILYHHQLIHVSKQLMLILPFSANLSEALGHICCNSQPGLCHYTLANIQKSIQAGEQLEHILQKIPHIPVLYKELITTGNQTNTLENSLKMAVHYYEDHMQKRLSFMQRIVPILLLLSLGGVLAFVAYSVLHPLYRIETWLS